MTAVRLAHCGPPEALVSGLLPTTGRVPSLLVSYVYLPQFLQRKHQYEIREWVMDSGAFSAHNSGTDIALEDYVAEVKRLKAEDELLTEVFALDVIGDWRESLKNCERMWDAGVEAIPTFHYGEPWEALFHIAKTYPKIALGGVVGLHAKKKSEFVGQCFARVWPKKMHGFGMAGEAMVMRYPFHSVDATNWEIGPCKFGRWNRYGQMSVRGSNQDLRGEVEWYMDLESRARVKWKKEMAKFDTNGPAVRLAYNNEYRSTAFAKEALQ